MTPLEIDIIMHYYCRADDYREGDFTAPAVRETINRFRDELGLLEPNKRDRQFCEPSAAYQLTERGRVFIDALMKVPLPVQKWVMPEGEGVSRC